MNYVCIHCGKEFEPNPRVKNQKYCNNKECQKARRIRWYRGKIAHDQDYKDNQRRCKKEWLDRHKGYYRNYRKKHPEYVQRNKALQAIRDIKRRKKDKPSILLAKIDSLIRPYYSRKGSMFRLILQDNGLLAKIDSLRVKLVPI